MLFRSVPDPATIKLVEVQAGPGGTGETERVVATADGKVKKDGYGIQGMKTPLPENGGGVFYWHFNRFPIRFEAARLQ